VPKIREGQAQAADESRQKRRRVTILLLKEIPAKRQRAGSGQLGQEGCFAIAGGSAEEKELVMGMSLRISQGFSEFMYQCFAV
jgi:hypothetical protein